MRRFSLAGLAIIGVLLVSSIWVGAPRVVRAQGNKTPVAHIWFREDFTTRANRWRLFDLGKAAVTYEQAGLTLKATPADYALWTIPDNDLKLDEYDIEVEAAVNSGGDDARIGMIIGYRNESDMLVMAVSPQGDAYLGNYYFGLWNDIIPPTKIKLDNQQPITLQAVINADHMLQLSVNGQSTGRTTLKNFKASGFGLFALTGESGGIDVAFRRFTVSDIK
jgi:hypothetical protein